MQTPLHQSPKLITEVYKSQRPVAPPSLLPQESWESLSKMYNGSSGPGSGKKPRPTTGYLVRPRLGALRSAYSTKPFSAMSPDKRKKLKKSFYPKMEWRRKPDYAETAYREAVGRLRILLAESYAPIKRPIKELDSAGEETDNQSLISAGSRNSRFSRHYYHYNPVGTPRNKYYYYPSLRSQYPLSVDPDKPLPELPKVDNSAPPELLSFIERQEDYIEQLEKESRYCREELSSLLSKVKDVISENENLHERQKSKLIKSVFDHLETETETETEVETKSCLKSPKKHRKVGIIEGPSIVFESRISELEAQLTQCKIDLKKAQDENETIKRRINDGTLLEGVGYESYKKQLDNLQRENSALQDTVKKLQTTLSLVKEKENDITDKVKRSLDVAEQAQYEKNAAEAEIRRLKDELERQHMKLRDAIAEQGRRVSDERTAVERRYTQQIEQLTTELGVQWETSNKLQMEIDKQRRENADLRREVAQKQALIDELRKEMQNKIITLQSDIGVSGAEKSALEQQISSLQMSNERNERQSKQEIHRLQAEIQSLRQRLDRADADLIHSRRENIRLSEQIASLEKEITLNAAVSEERNLATPRTPRSGEIVALPPPAPKKEDREMELTSLINDMENKHAATVAELEGMIHSQNQLMEKLSNECHALTQKLDDTAIKHKEEIRQLQTNLDYLKHKFSQSQFSTPNTTDEEHLQKSTDQTQLPQQVSPTTTSKPTEESSSIQNNALEIEDNQQHQTNYDYPQDMSNNDYQYDPNYDPNQYDPNQQYDPSVYDPNQQYDPNQYDPNQEYDPNQQYDPNQEYDPNQYVPGNEEQIEEQSVAPTVKEGGDNAQ